MGIQNLQAQNKGWYLKQLLADRETKEQVGAVSLSLQQRRQMYLNSLEVSLAAKNSKECVPFNHRNNQDFWPQLSRKYKGLCANEGGQNKKVSEKEIPNK